MSGSWQKLEAAVDKLLEVIDGKTFCPGGAGGGVDPTCGGDGGGSSGGGGGGGGGGGANEPNADPSSAGYAKLKTGSEHIAVDPNGEVKLKNPSTPQESVKQLNGMDKLLEAALKQKGDLASRPDSDKDRLNSVIRALHVAQQMQRAMGMAYKMAAPKKADLIEDLLTLLKDLVGKYNLQPVDPDKVPEPKLELKE